MGSGENGVKMGSGQNGVKSTVDPCSKLIRVKGRLDPFFSGGAGLALRWRFMPASHQQRCKGEL